MSRAELHTMPGGNQRESLGELLSQLASSSAGLVRDEIALAKQEMSEKATEVGAGVAVVAAGAVLGLLALGAFCAAAIIGLASLVGAWQAALLVGALLAIAGGIIAYLGLKRLRTTRLAPSETIRTLQEDKEWIKEMT